MKLLSEMFSEQFELDVGTEKFVLLTIISEKFQNQTRNQRQQQVEPLIQETGLNTGIIELYTPTEANNENINLKNTTENFWNQFEQALWEQIQPDIMLIDARTGLNEWGGLSLLRLADEAFITLYPSTQNTEGVCLIREVLKKLAGMIKITTYYILKYW